MKTLDQVQRAKIRQGGLDTFYNAAACLIAGLATSVQTANCPLNRSNFDRAERVLAALPLGTNEYQIAKKRLQNSWQYNLNSETGAAAYELRQISKRLKR